MPFPVACYPKMSRPGNGGGVSFVGLLDDYTTRLEGLYCPYQRLLSSWTGIAGTVRRLMDSEPFDVTYLPDGTWNVAALTTFLGGSGYSWASVADQTGQSRPLVQASTAAQPRGTVDGNGIPYLYPPDAGFGTTFMRTATGLGASCENGTDSTVLCVNGSPAFAFHTFAGLQASGGGRDILNFGNNIVNVVDSAGGHSIISGTGVYSCTGQVNAAGNRLNNGVTLGTNGLGGAAFTLDSMSVGLMDGGVMWLQDAPFYCGAFWSRMLNNTDADAVNALMKTLFQTT